MHYTACLYTNYYQTINFGNTSEDSNQVFPFVTPYLFIIYYLGK